MNLTKDFHLTEFVPKDIHDQFGDKSIMFLDQRLPKLVQSIRDIVGKPITINDWFDGGTFTNRGYRVPDCKIGAKLSQHKFGRAADLEVDGISYEEFRNIIRFNFQFLNTLGLTTIEKDTPTWLHIDMRWTGLTTINEVPFK